MKEYTCYKLFLLLRYTNQHRSGFQGHPMCLLLVQQARPTEGIIYTPLVTTALVVRDTRFLSSHSFLLK